MGERGGCGGGGAIGAIGGAIGIGGIGIGGGGIGGGSCAKPGTCCIDGVSGGGVAYAGEAGML